jgi:cell division protein FtsL
MIESIDQYIYGSTAKKLQYDVYKENKVLNSKRKMKKSKKLKTKMILTLLLLFGCSMISIYRYAHITDLNYKSKQTLNELNEVRNENLTTDIRIGNALELSKVREFAEKKFNMHKPEPYQKVVVSVPKSDFIESSIDR